MKHVDIRIYDLSGFPGFLKILKEHIGEPSVPCNLTVCVHVFMYFGFGEKS